jgi:predicted outer membrane repeat protein
MDRGGGVYYQEVGSPQVLNCLFSGNYCTVSGGGLYAKGGNPIIYFSTFFLNSGTVRGGGLYTEEQSSPQATSSVFWRNYDPGGTDETAQIDGDAPDLEYCCIQGWSGAMGGTGNFGGEPGFDPLFVDPFGADLRIGTADDNLHLQSSSPLIDAGKRIGFVLEDFEGDPRPFDGTTEQRGDGFDWDVGCDEYYVAPTATPTPTTGLIPMTPVPLVNGEPDGRIDALDLLWIFNMIEGETYEQKVLIDFCRFWMEDAR